VTTRVIQWATSPVGSVRVFVYSPDKVGVDAGALVGRPDTRRHGPLVMGKMLCVFPNSVRGHIEEAGEWSAPFGRGGGFAPVVGDSGGLAVVEFGDADVPVEASIAVIARPFDDDDVLEVKSPTDF